MSETTTPDFVITEGVAGTWHYHWSRAESWTRALCGAQTMRTEMRPRQWGTTGHLSESYCNRCAARLSQTTQEA